MSIHSLDHFFPQEEEYWPPIVGLIAAKNPVASLVTTVDSLFTGGACRVIVVDDGSDSEVALEAFDEVERRGGEVIHLPKNMGKSNALRAGFQYLGEDGDFLIAQADDDTIAGDLTVPAKMIADGKADIVDIRVETFDGSNVVGLAQQLDYWLVNATVKRFQDWFHARLWLSGASVMYTSEAAQVMLMAHSVTQTEDTEGRFRAVGAGLKVRYCASKEAQFKTMVPESVGQLAKQWQRWAIGNGQVIGVHGFGGGSKRIATLNVLTWINMFTAPVLQFFLANWVPAPSFMDTPHVPGQDMAYVGPLIPAAIWMGVFGIAVGIIGAVVLRRISLALVGIFIPMMSLLWTFNALIGIVLAVKRPLPKSLTWDPPTRMDAAKVLADVNA